MLKCPSKNLHLKPSTHRRKPRVIHRSEREANTRLRVLVGSVFQRGTQMC